MSPTLRPGHDFRLPITPPIVRVCLNTGGFRLSGVAAQKLWSANHLLVAKMQDKFIFWELTSCKVYLLLKPLRSICCSSITSYLHLCSTLALSLCSLVLQVTSSYMKPACIRCSGSFLKGQISFITKTVLILPTKLLLVPPQNGLYLLQYSDTHLVQVTAQGHILLRIQGPNM